WAVAEQQRREHRVVRAECSVTGEVSETGAGQGVGDSICGAGGGRGPRRRSGGFRPPVHFFPPPPRGRACPAHTAVPPTRPGRAGSGQVRAASAERAQNVADGARQSGPPCSAAQGTPCRLDTGMMTSSVSALSPKGCKRSSVSLRTRRSALARAAASWIGGLGAARRRAAKRKARNS